MERTTSPAESGSLAASSPPSSPPSGEPDAVASAVAAAARKKKASRKKRKPTAEEEGEPPRKNKKLKQKRKDKEDGSRPKKSRSKSTSKPRPDGLTAAQMAVNEQMRRALEEDQYSANGSIVDTDSDDDEHQFVYKGQSIRLDRNFLLQATRKHLYGAMGMGNAGKAVVVSGGGDGDDSDSRRGGRKKKKVKRKDERSSDRSISSKGTYSDGDDRSSTMGGATSGAENDFDRDEGSIFGQTTGSSNSTWVECDKCKKWRRLRGVVDERKLPPKWYCSMNKNDPERSRCSAPEEEYDASSTPESAADARTRKHLRVWVRRLQCNEAYESRQPTLTRGKKRAVASTSKDPYEWIRCCNPSCGKWRAILRIMDAKTSVMDRCLNGEWYCVMNTWDEKTASCAAPQENLPAVGCPPWVMQDDN